MTSSVKKIEPRVSRAQHLLAEQVGNEFRASQQYLAIAVWFDQRDLPRLAAHFYRRSLRKRTDALRIVQYMMDSNLAVEIPAVPTVRSDFSEPRELIALALEQERAVTAEVATQTRTVREDGDYLGEQFMRWFLAEQVDAVSQMSTMLNVLDRAHGNLFDVEDYLARESVGRRTNDSLAPQTAGGAVGH
ncbi:ferritin [Saccharopolyspora phatthalungensis]|uniref:Ferritin n=1 Tax=Saccharopolyspora phatthalungensis TaxID=664693 RepID=A0A840QEX8_9PSEU|nr:ferritin [Saccharopolyspora phatthalungensis]MBB5158440.1 ferritin [Saccharopolyspora phatthalungensis]